MEYLYGLYILSGIIKGFLNFFSIPTIIDFTLLTGVVVAVVLVFQIVTQKNSSFAKMSFTLSVLFLMFYIWINLTIIYSASNSYSYQKSLFYLTNMIAVIIPLFYKRFQIKNFLRFFILLTTVLGVIFLMVFPAIIYKTTDEARAFQTLYLSLPLFCGFCLLFLVIIQGLFLFSISCILIILNALVIILSGARGPIIFLILVLMLFFFINKIRALLHRSQSIKSNKKGKLTTVRKIIMIASVIVAVTVLLVLYVPDMEKLFTRSQGRMEGLLDFATSGTGSASAVERVNRLKYALDMIPENLKAIMMGYGLGSYGVMYGGADERSYPHNIILEVWFETGLIGLLAFLPFFVFVVYASRHHILSNPFAWVGLFLFLNIMKSGSLVDLRIFFCCLSIMVLFSRKYYTKGPSIYNKRFHISTQKP